MSQKPRKRLPTAVLERARQLAEEQVPAPASPRAPANTVVGPGSAPGPAGRNAVKAKITQALRKLHPMD